MRSNSIKGHVAQPGQSVWLLIEVDSPSPPQPLPLEETRRTQVQILPCPSGAVTQLVERQAHNLFVMGSSPIGPIEVNHATL